MEAEVEASLWLLPASQEMGWSFSPLLSLYALQLMSKVTSLQPMEGLLFQPV